MLCKPGQNLPCRPVWPESWSDPPASVFQVLGLQICLHLDRWTVIKYTPLKGYKFSWRWWHTTLFPAVGRDRKISVASLVTKLDLEWSELHRKALSWRLKTPKRLQVWIMVLSTLVPQTSQEEHGGMEVCENSEGFWENSKKTQALWAQFLRNTEFLEYIFICLPGIWIV